MADDDFAWTPELTHAKYVEFEGVYAQALKRYKRIIRRILSKSEISATLVKLRSKTQMGVFTKQLDRSYSDPWAECADFIGARIDLYLSQAIRPASLLPSKVLSITVLDVEDKELTRDPKHLKYGGLHVQIESDEFLGPTGQPIQCEVQVRTIAEHTWAETEHKYVYKGPKGLPLSVQRTFARLLALVELMDDELVRGVEDVKNSDMFDDHLLVQFLRTSAQEFGINSSSESMTVGFIGDLLECLEMNAKDLTGTYQSFIEASSEQIQQIVDSREVRHRPGFK